MKIHSITAREILDSRGNPTVAATVELEDGILAEASVPSGASTGQNERLEKRDQEKDRFFGQGVLSAVSNVNMIIAPALVGQEAGDQKAIDECLIGLDGTKKKENLGANAILAVSLAVARAESISRGLELFEYLRFCYSGESIARYNLPTPMFNIINGGKHARNNIDIQETMIVPIGFRSFEKKLRAGSEIYHALMNELVSRGLETGVGDEGGFAPEIEKNELVFDLVGKAIELAGYSKDKVRISIDLAASSFAGGEDTYTLKNGNEVISSEQLLKKVAGWATKYDLLSVEDGLSENDYNWKQLTGSLGKTISIGDDLFTTDPEKIELGAKEKLAGGVIIKPNQIGTLTETFEAVRRAKAGALKVIVSHRSGETEDTFIADLAVAVEADFIKSGAPSHSERLAKYNRLSKIEDEISESYA